MSSFSHIINIYLYTYMSPKKKNHTHTHILKKILRANKVMLENAQDKSQWIMKSKLCLIMAKELFIIFFEKLMLYIGFKLWLQENLKSCHDFGHRDTIGLAERLVFWDGKSWHDLGNHDAIQQLPHQVYLKGTGHNGWVRTIVARLVKIVTRLWTFMTSI